jgi:hydroxyacylglutathione hydrolase
MAHRCFRGDRAVFLEKIKTEGLAHLSYILGSAGEAAVVDPRRDIEVYLTIAAEHGCRISHVFETHRNEDLISGAAPLAARTGAAVHHGPKAAGDVRYADVVREGDQFQLGSVHIGVLETPGHTDDSLSYVWSDSDVTEDPVGVFTGDALFVGDVGRTDFYPDRAREVAGLLYDSLQKLLALGDHVVIHPAHGAGSVCGSGMADREISTIGFERRHNPRLQIGSRDAFIDAKLEEHHTVPPYFKLMETLNLSGPPPLAHPLCPAPLTAANVKAAMDHAVIVDVRNASAFLGAHLPRSLSLPLDMIASYAGWLLEPEDDLVLVADDAAHAAAAAVHLARIGFDRVRGYLAPSLTAWAATGEAFNTLPVLDTDEVRERVASPPDDWTLLDVRGEEEVAESRITGSRHVYLGDLPPRDRELDRGRRYTVMCGSGARATVGASVLLRAGFDRVDLFFGSIGAWRSAGLATESTEAVDR